MVLLESVNIVVWPRIPFALIDNSLDGGKGTILVGNNDGSTSISNTGVVAQSGSKLVARRASVEDVVPLRAEIGNSYSEIASPNMHEGEATIRTLFDRFVELAQRIILVRLCGRILVRRFLDLRNGI